MLDACSESGWLGAEKKHNKKTLPIWLVVESTHLKNISQTGLFFQVGMNIKKNWNHQVDYLSGWEPWLVQVAFFFHSPYGPCPSYP